MLTLHSPLALVLAPLAVLFILYSGRKNGAGMRFSSGDLAAGLRLSLKVSLSRKLVYLRAASCLFVVLALSRPQSPMADSRIESEGVDIVLAVDSSTSMLAEDFKLNGVRRSRIDVVKDVVRDFVKARHDDRLALVTFAGRAYTACPLTFDHAWLNSNVERLKSGMVEDGTAIGSGLGASLNRLKNSQAKSKAVILLTDGRNNAGSLSPQTAAEAARALGVKVYTIGAGSKGLVPYPVRDMFGNKAYQQVQADIDEELLKNVAESTGARYYRAVDTESLRAIYAEIDKLEKTPLRDKGYLEHNELFPVFLVPGILLLLLEIVLSNTVLRTVP